MALRRERVESNGETLELPLPDGPGKALKLTIAPVQERIPIYLAAIGPKNTALAAEIADGWIPTLFSPEHVAEFRPLLEEGFARAGDGKSLDDFDIAPTVNVLVTDDLRRGARRDAPLPRALRRRDGLAQAELLQPRSPPLRLRGRRAATVQDLYLEASKEEAAAALPDELIDAVSLCGPPDVVRERLAVFRDAGVGTLIVTPMAWSLEDRLRAAPAASPSWPRDAPARPRAARPGRGDEAAIAALVARLRRELPRLDAAGLGAAPARARARPLARADRRRLVVDPHRGSSRAGASSGSSASPRPSSSARCRSPPAAPPAHPTGEVLTVEPVPGRAHVSAVFTHPDRWREGIAAGAARPRRGRDARRGLPQGAAVDAARGAGAPVLRGRRAGATTGASSGSTTSRCRSSPTSSRCEPMRVYLGAFGDAGHAFPMLALGEALVARGHAVALQTWRNWEEPATAGGMTFAAAPEYQVFPTRERPLQPYAGGRPCRARDRPVGRVFAPDVVVSDILTAAPALAAELCGVPVGDARPARAPLVRARLPALSLGARLPRTRAGAHGWRAFDHVVARGLEQRPRRVQRLPRAARAAAAARLHTGLSRELTLVATLPQLEYPRHWRPWLRVVGPLLWEPPGERVDAAARRRAGRARRALDRAGPRATGCCAPPSPGSRARRSA